MNKRKAWLSGIRVAVVVSATFTTGCMSYSFTGKHNTSPSAVNGGPFHVDSYAISGEIVHNEIPAAWWAVAAAGKDLRKEDIGRALHVLNPKMFSASDRSCPIEVSVRIVAAREEHVSGVLVLLVSLFILPGWSTYYDDCEVRVHVGGNDGVECPVERIGYTSKQWVTLLSPIGLFQPKSRKGFNGEFRYGRGGMDVEPRTNLKCSKDRQEVFCSEVARAVAGAIARCDPNTLKRAVLLNSLAEGQNK